jgi:hypothetical protein
MPKVVRWDCKLSCAYKMSMQDNPIVYQYNCKDTEVD